MRIGYRLPVFLLVILFVLTINLMGSGHKYLDTEAGEGREDPVLVPDHQISWAAYEELATEDQVDYYRFTAESGEEIYASLLIPKIESLSKFNPDLALIGPGLKNDPSGITESGTPPLAVQEDEDVLVKKYEGNNEESFFEPFTQTNYWEHQVIRKPVNESGTYHVAVWSGNDKVGKYVLAIGEREDFGFSDILEYPSVWWKVRTHNGKILSSYIISGAVLGGLTVGTYFLIRGLF